MGICGGEGWYKIREIMSVKMVLMLFLRLQIKFRGIIGILFCYV